MPSPGSVRSVKIYCYYSNSDKDRKIWEELKRHFAVLTRLERIKLYNCHEILPGSDFEQKNEIFLSMADIVLPLLSCDFFHDRFCWTMMYLTMERYDRGEIKLVPIQFRAVHYKGTPFEKLLVLPKGKPITGWKDSQEAHKNVVESIDDLVTTLRNEWERSLVLRSFETARFSGNTQEGLG